MAKLSFAVFLLFVAYAVCDLYMHNPRGSNDRLNEANTNRNNGNRLFDSQNNAKGGYCIGPQMTFYEGSLLSIEWTNQHGCGSNPKMVCNLVVQYMCGANNADPSIQIRDGTTTDTIPATSAGATAVDANGNLLYGMHESLQSYLDCNTRTRDMGLYIADRAAVGGLTAARSTSIYTRQNNNGNRNGLECAEERDYYPYWHPSLWKDAAILTSQKQFCDFYQSNSQNVKEKGYCTDPANPGPQVAANNQGDCASNSYTWVEQPGWGIAAPICDVVPWSRENHLGNGVDGFANSFNWTIPTGESCVAAGNCVCVLRLRYNVTTLEVGFPNMNNPSNGFVDWNNNAGSSVVTQNTNTPLNLSAADAANNATQSDFLTMAQDTSQFGRTFQDRSHTFVIASRPSGISSTARIYNLNVRGKRGNIVQTYPATEYDFVPQYLYARVGDYIHFQWTGCDQNPAGNAGEGTDQTDRSNAVQMLTIDSSIPVTDAWCQANPKKVLFQSAALRLNMAFLGQQNCLPYATVLANNNNNAAAADEDVTNCAKLNAASQYFNGGLIKMNHTGTFAYMNTRNHAFSNRDQKAIIYIVPLLPAWAVGVVITGAVLLVGAAGVAGAMFYAKSHPHSGVANLFSKM
jgi:hypothetical protein